MIIRSASLFSFFVFNNQGEDDCDTISDDEFDEILETRQEAGQLKQHNPLQTQAPRDAFKRDLVGTAKENINIQAKEALSLKSVIDLVILLGNDAIVPKAIYGKGKTAYEVVKNYLDTTDTLILEASAIDIDGNTVLHSLAQDGDRSFNVTKLLLDELGKCYQRNSQYKNTLHLCDITNHEGIAPLHLAVKSCAIETIKLLAEKTTILAIWHKFLAPQKTQFKSIQAIKRFIKEKPNLDFFKKEFFGILLLNKAWQVSYQNFITILHNQELDGSSKAHSIMCEHCEVAILFDLESNSQLKNKLFELDCEYLLQIAKKWSADTNTKHSRAPSPFNEKITLFFLNNPSFLEKFSAYKGQEKTTYINNLLEIYVKDQDKWKLKARGVAGRNERNPQKINQYVQDVIGAVIEAIEKKQKPAKPVFPRNIIRPNQQHHTTPLFRR